MNSNPRHSAKRTSVATERLEKQKRTPEKRTRSAPTTTHPNEKQNACMSTNQPPRQLQQRSKTSFPLVSLHTRSTTSHILHFFFRDEHLEAMICTPSSICQIIIIHYGFYGNWRFGLVMNGDDGWHIHGIAGWALIWVWSETCIINWPEGVCATFKEK